MSTAIKVLEQIKLIKVVKVKQKGKFDSNHYWIYRPNMIDRVQWLDINGDILRGVHYNFNHHQFKRSSDGKVKDKLLDGLLLNVANQDKVDVR